ncbi:MAG: hypothetical protein U0172_10775 [Nitrospiraceae bacterium]
MKEIEVGLLITSRTLSLSDISAHLGLPYASGSREKGSKLGKQEVLAMTVWRLDTPTGAAHRIETAFSELTTQVPPERINSLLASAPDTAVWFDVAVYFDTPMAAVQIPKECVDIAAGYRAAIEVSYYPSAFGASPSESGQPVLD